MSEFDSPNVINIKENDSVSVIASFDRKGNIIPLYFRYGTDEQITIKILSSHALNSSPYDIFLKFICKYMQENIMKSVRLVYCCKEHFWYIDK